MQDNIFVTYNFTVSIVKEYSFKLLCNNLHEKQLHLVSVALEMGTSSPGGNEWFITALDWPIEKLCWTSFNFNERIQYLIGKQSITQEFNTCIIFVWLQQYI